MSKVFVIIKKVNVMQYFLLLFYRIYIINRIVIDIIFFQLCRYKEFNNDIFNFFFVIGRFFLVKSKVEWVYIVRVERFGREGRKVDKELYGEGDRRQDVFVCLLYGDVYTKSNSVVKIEDEDKYQQIKDVMENVLWIIIGFF